MDTNTDIRHRNVGQQPLDDSARNAKRIAILVLGDIGRSPRMQYHALSLAQAGHHVDFIGYDGARPMEEVLGNPRIALRHIKIPPQLSASSRAAFIVLAPLKIAYQIMLLFWILLFAIQRPHYILVQNPPAIPTLLVARVCAWLTGVRLVIDWHNYGYTILGMKLGPRHPIVVLAQRFERFFGTSAYAHLCVTDAMAADLQRSWGIRGQLVVLHDKAPRHFRRLGVEEIHQLWKRLLSDPQLEPLRQLSAGNESLLTCRSSDGTIEMRKSRPMLIVSSTSWTADEDFSILLSALKLYDTKAASRNACSGDCVTLPPLAVLITGKGPLREHYEQEISQMELQQVHIATAWLSAEDYPLLLGSADLGVSMHTSSSGLDLPMKVVDMLGCGTPVCAYRFSCINELVTEANGLVFDSAEELAQHVQDLAESQLSESDGIYQRLFEGAATFRTIDWATNYKRALELF